MRQNNNFSAGIKIICADYLPTGTIVASSDVYAGVLKNCTVCSIEDIPNQYEKLAKDIISDNSFPAEWRNMDAEDGNCRYIDLASCLEKYLGRGLK